MWGKNFLTQTDWEPEGGVKFLKEIFEKRDMWATAVLPLCKKGERVQPCLEKFRML
jgi:hypothetical protein